MAMKIARVEPGSEAEVLGLGPGDELLSVDENELNDSLDYDFYTDSKSFHLKARVADGIREWDVQRTERGPFAREYVHLTKQQPLFPYHRDNHIGELCHLASA